MKRSEDRKGTCLTGVHLVIGLFLTGRGAYGILEVKTMRILIYNDQTDKMETYSLRCSDNMPYTALSLIHIWSHEDQLTGEWQEFVRLVDELIRKGEA